MSEPRVVRSSISIKCWLSSRPTVEAVRPPRCPVCLAPSRPLGGALGLWGHGLGLRRVRGAVCEALALPADTEIQCRRYRCRAAACGAVVVVVPTEVLPRRRYLVTAIALALFLWAELRLSQGDVFAEVTGLPPGRLDRPDRWRTLARWARAAFEGRLFGRRPESSGPQVRRSTVQAVVDGLVGAAPPTTREAPRRIRVLEGARHAM